MAARKDREPSASDREIIGTRVLDAPRELVFEAWSKPEHIMHWWGPRGFTNTFDEFDFRPGGAWNFVMHGPDGTDYKNRSVFVEIVRPERIVFDHVNGPLFRATITFEVVEENKTLLTWRMLFDTVSAYEQVKGFAVPGLEQNLDKLAACLGMMSDEHDIVSTREFAVPRRVMFEAWTKAEHLQHWWGPEGFTNTFHEFDPRPGGAWRFVMHGPDGTDYPNESVFVEIVEPERIVFDHLSDHRFRVTATFVEHDGRTRVTFRMHFDSAAERDRIKQLVMSANEQNFDRLAAELAKMV